MIISMTAQCRVWSLAHAFSWLQLGVNQSGAGCILLHDLVIPLKETAIFTSDRDQVLCERLNRHPHLRARVESLLEVVENAAGVCFNPRPLE